MRNNVKINIGPSEIPETLREALWILIKLRHHSKKWKEEYGAANRERMNEWEEKADEFIGRVIIKKPDQ